MFIFREVLLLFCHHKHLVSRIFEVDHVRPDLECFDCLDYIGVQALLRLEHLLHLA